MRATQAHIDAFKTDEETQEYLRDLAKLELLEIQKTGGSTVKFKTEMNENYTINSLLNEVKAPKKLKSVKTKTSSSSAIRHQQDTEDLFD